MARELPQMAAAPGIGDAETRQVRREHRRQYRKALWDTIRALIVVAAVAVLDEVLTYEVDQIAIVLPEELERLHIQTGQDQCTLVTCTPYGINTHRLLVRGTRVDSSEVKHIRVTAEAFKIDPILVAPFLAAPLLLLALVVLLLRSGRRGRKKRASREDWEQRPGS